MTRKARKLSDEDLLDALTDAALAKAEANVKAGKPPSAAELNGLRRMVQRRAQERELEEMRRLTTG